MSELVEFRLERDDLRNVRFLLQRNDLHLNGDLESGFFDTIAELRRHSPGRDLSTCLIEAADISDTDCIVVSQNPDLLLDDQLPSRIGRALSDLAPIDDWSVAAAGGLGLEGKNHLALYASQMPLIPPPEGPAPLVDPLPDLYVVNAHLLRRIAQRRPLPDRGLGLALTVEGYLEGFVGVFLPRLRAGINGALLAVDTNAPAAIAERFADRLPGQTIATRAGDAVLDSGSDCPPGPNIGHCIARTIARHSRLPSLSIVTRTRFDRVHLLERLLASISRARHSGVDVEIVLASDADPATCAVMIARLREQFGHLQIVLAHAEPGDRPSRVANLLTGLAAATNDYVLIVDDDDYLDISAFDNIGPAFFGGGRPFIITSTSVHEEEWTSTPSERWVLSADTPVRTYPAAGWRQMFGGTNHLPICAAVMPREWLNARLSTFSFTHDLSEDYALFLLLLSDPDLPTIFETERTMCHVSIRGTQNSVTMQDRRPWIRDITRYLDDLTADPHIAAPGAWSVLAAQAGRADQIAREQAASDLRAALDRAEMTIQSLRRETVRLRALATRQPETV